MSHMPPQPQGHNIKLGTLPVESATGETGGMGWYLYGLIWRDAADDTKLGVLLGLGEEPVLLVEYDELIAVVRRVPIGEWQSDALRTRLHDIAWLEAAVRGHNRVVELVHEQHTMLPAKFGCVYASRDDLARALMQEGDALRRQLEYVTACDEWGVRISMERSALEAQADNDDSNLHQLRQQMATASPGRAYLMKRTLADALVAARERAVRAVGQQAYDQFMQHARAGELQPAEHHPVEVSSDQEHKVPVEHLFRAAFLVPRSTVSEFLAAGDHLAERIAGLHCAYSGPWPPYTFAALAAPAQERLS